MVLTFDQTMLKHLLKTDFQRRSKMRIHQITLRFVKTKENILTF